MYSDLYLNFYNLIENKHYLNITNIFNKLSKIKYTFISKSDTKVYFKVQHINWFKKVDRFFTYIMLTPLKPTITLIYTTLF